VWAERRWVTAERSAGCSRGIAIPEPRRCRPFAAVSKVGVPLGAAVGVVVGERGEMPRRA
jgi:hypothetical protein